MIATYLDGLGGPEATTSVRAEPEPGCSLGITRGRVLNAAGDETGRFDVYEPITLEIEYVVREPVEGAIVTIEVKRNGALLFQTFDADTDPGRLEGRRPGRYCERVTLPCPLLKTGHYSLSLGTGIANKGRIHLLEDSLTFDVELVSRPSSFLSYSNNRAGLLATPLEWQRLGQER